MFHRAPSFPCSFQNSSAPSSSPPGPSTTYTICLPIDSPDVSACNSALAEIASPSTSVAFNCVTGGSVVGCLSMVKNNGASFAKVPGSGVLEGESFGLRPVVSEYFASVGQDYIEGYSVAIVSNTWCYTSTGDTKSSWTDLANSDACFSGYITDGGWNVPVGTMLNSGAMPLVDNSTAYTEDAQSTLKYFNSVS